MTYKQFDIVPGGGGKRRGKSTIIHCHYKSYEGGLKNEVSVIVPTNFGEDCSPDFDNLFTIELGFS